MIQRGPRGWRTDISGCTATDRRGRRSGSRPRAGRSVSGAHAIVAIPGMLARSSSTTASHRSWSRIHIQWPSRAPYQTTRHRPSSADDAGRLRPGVEAARWPRRAGRAARTRSTTSRRPASRARSRRYRGPGGVEHDDDRVVRRRRVGGLEAESATTVPTPGSDSMRSARPVPSGASLSPPMGGGYRRCPPVNPAIAVAAGSGARAISSRYRPNSVSAAPPSCSARGRPRARGPERASRSSGGHRGQLADRRGDRGRRCRIAQRPTPD